EQVGQHPHAAAVLVGLLRLTSGISVADGVVAESLAYSVLLAAPEFARWRAATPWREPQPDPEPVVRLDRDGDLLTIALRRPRRSRLEHADPAARAPDGPRARGGWDGQRHGTDRTLADELPRPVRPAHRRRHGTPVGARRPDSVDSLRGLFRCRRRRSTP